MISCFGRNQLRIVVSENSFRILFSWLIPFLNSYLQIVKHIVNVILQVMNLIGDVKGKVAVMVDDMIDTAGESLHPHLGLYPIANEAPMCYDKVVL